jgi:hypothetical protein
MTSNELTLQIHSVLRSLLTYGSREVARHLSRHRQWIDVGEYHHRHCSNVEDIARGADHRQLRRGDWRSVAMTGDHTPMHGDAASRTTRSRASWVAALLIGAVVVGCGAGSTLFAARYHEVPNVFTLPSITYTPEHGPANELLLASRPEQVFQRYVEDYIHLAGTYPCLADLGLPYYDYGKGAIHPLLLSGG